MLPTGTVVDDPYCLPLDVACCGSGSGADMDCCPTAPPATLYAALLVDGADPCACLADCVTLAYNAALDAWLSASISDACGDLDFFLRLRCRAGLWEFDVVDDAGAAAVVVLSGEVTSSNCDPFLIEADFTDEGALVCGGSFTYLLTEVDCASGAPVVNACCPGGVPRALTLSFAGGTGTCTCLDGDSITLTFDESTTPDSWRGTLGPGTGCPGAAQAVALTCEGTTWRLLIGGSETGQFSSTCDPLSLVFHVSLPPLGNVCSGTTTAMVTP